MDDKRVVLSSRDTRIENGYIQGIDLVLDPVLNQCDEVQASGQVNKCCDGYYGPQCTRAYHLNTERDKYRENRRDNGAEG